MDQSDRNYRHDISDNGENGDMCNADQGTITSIADGTAYTVQQMYSAQSGLCQTTRTDANDLAQLVSSPRCGGSTNGPRCGPGL